MNSPQPPTGGPDDPARWHDRFTRLLPPWGQRAMRTAPWGLGLITGLTISLLAFIALAVALAQPYLPDIGSLTDYRPRLPLRVYSADGVLIGEYGEERRHFVPIAQIPKVLQDAVLAVEDARFREHNGVDYKGLMRAGLVQFVRPLSQGASTITMQVARNFYLPLDKNYQRKAWEMMLALKIEQQLGKDQILEIYMNQIYLGQRAHGFASASEIYFGKPLGELTLAEAALLAGLPQGPNTRNPVVDPGRAIERQHHVLDRMLDNGFITEQQRNEARAQALSFRPSAPQLPAYAQYAAEAARQLVFSRWGADAYSHGLNVHLTIDSAEQMAAYRALRKGILDFERRQAWRGPGDTIELPSDASEADARIAEALADHPDSDELKAAVAAEVGPKKVVAVLRNGESIAITGEGLRAVAPALVPRAGRVALRAGAVIRVVQGAKGLWAITQLPQVEGAFVSMDPSSGAIRAMVGGFDHAKSQFNRATQAWRQPGSSLKPFIYSAALERGYTPATVINDAPLSFDAAATGGIAWDPKNSDNVYDGPMSMRRALAKSKNMVSIRLLQAIGVPQAQRWLTRFGLDADRQPGNLTLALGAGSVTPLQLASAYSVFANGGYRLAPVLISRVTDARGQVLNEVAPVLPPDEWQRVLDERNAFVMNSLLGDVTRPGGTAARAQAALKRADIHGKTGTTNDAVDAWFAGYQRQRVAVAWMGYDKPRSLGEGESGGGLSLPIWLDYMAFALKGVAVEEPPPPDGVVEINGEWYFDEYTPGTSMGGLGINEQLPAAPSESERRSILDLFKP